jgi:hypothetical protein
VNVKLYTLQELFYSYIQRRVMLGRERNSTAGADCIRRVSCNIESLWRMYFKTLVYPVGLFKLQQLDVKVLKLLKKPVAQAAA